MNVDSITSHTALHKVRHDEQAIITYMIAVEPHRPMPPRLLRNRPLLRAI